MFKKIDFIIIIFFFAVALFLFLMPKGDKADYFYIYKDNSLYKKIAATKSELVIIDNGDSKNVIKIENGTAKMVEASCPDGVCLNQKAISHENEMIVCIPNSVIVKATGKQSKVDGVSY